MSECFRIKQYDSGVCLSLANNNKMKTDLIEIFQTIRASLQPYATLGFDNRTNSETIYDLWSNKNVEIDGTKRNELFFCSISIESDSVHLHIFPNDSNSDLKTVVADDLGKLQTEDGVIKIQSLDDSLMEQIESAISASYKLYKERGWVV